MFKWITQRIQPCITSLALTSKATKVYIGLPHRHLQITNDMNWSTNFTITWRDADATNHQKHQHTNWECHFKMKARLDLGLKSWKPQNKPFKYHQLNYYERKATSHLSFTKRLRFRVYGVSMTQRFLYLGLCSYLFTISLSSRFIEITSPLFWQIYVRKNFACIETEMYKWQNQNGNWLVYFISLPIPSVIRESQTLILLYWK